MLKEDRLREALDYVYLEAVHAQQPEIAQRVEAIRQDYYRMLDVFCKGMPDPGREQLMNQLWEKAWQLTEQPYQNTQSASLFAQMDTDEPLWVHCHRLSAYTIHLLQHFDPKGMEELYVYTFDDQPNEIRVRALTGIVICAIVHNHRVRHLPRLQEQLNLLAEEARQMKKDENWLLSLQLLLLQSTDAIRARELLHTKINALLEKYAIEMMNKKQKEIDEQKAAGILPDGETGDKSSQDSGRISRLTLNLDDNTAPWNKTKEGRELRELVAEYMVLISDGADSHLEIFETATRLDFFSKGGAEHWLAPFSPEQPDVARMIAERPYLKVLAEQLQLMTDLCDSDLYSHFFMLSRLNEELLQGVSNVMKAISALAMSGVVSGPVLRTPDSEVKPSKNAEPLTLSQTMRRYLHDLFRFCTFSGHVQKEYNPFKKKLDFHRIPWLYEAVSDNVSQKTIALFLYKKDRYDEAIPILRRLVQAETTEDNLIKLADSVLQSDEADRKIALEALTLCNHFYPDNMWTVMNLSKLLAEFHYYTEQDIMLQEALQRWPDNIDIMLDLGRCRMAQNRKEQALDFFYKCDFLQEGDPEIQRELAQACLQVGNIANAEKYISLLLRRRSKITHYDRLIGGHIALSAQNIPLAIERYRKAYLHGKRDGIWKDKDYFFNLFSAMMSDIAREIHVPRSSVMLIIDAIKHTK